MHGSDHQSILGSQRPTSICRSLSEELGVREELNSETPGALIMEAGQANLHLIFSLEHRCPTYECYGPGLKAVQDFRRMQSAGQ